MKAIGVHNVVCVNALWQSSALDGGPAARNKEAWKKGSLVRVLVDETLKKCWSKVAETKRAKTLWEAVLEHALKPAMTYLTAAELVDCTKVCRTFGASLPAAFLARKSVVLLKRLVFTSCADEMMSIAGLTVVEKYCVAGYTMSQIDKLSMEKMMTIIAPSLFTNRRVTSLALCLHGAALALDYQGERALRGTIAGIEGPIRMQSVHSMMAKVAMWAI